MQTVQDCFFSVSCGVWFVTSLPGKGYFVGRESVFGETVSGKMAKEERVCLFAGESRTFAQAAGVQRVLKGWVYRCVCFDGMV